jgi:hypothetical protein
MVREAVQDALELTRPDDGVRDDLPVEGDLDGFLRERPDGGDDELLAAHRLWSDWLREGRVRKIAFVAEKQA